MNTTRSNYTTHTLMELTAMNNQPVIGKTFHQRPVARKDRPLPLNPWPLLGLALVLLWGVIPAVVYFKG